MSHNGWLADFALVAQRCDNGSETHLFPTNRELLPKTFWGALTVPNNNILLKTSTKYALPFDENLPSNQPNCFLCLSIGVFCRSGRYQASRRLEWGVL